ncbi:CMRF35-like molecule 8 [Hoplias malabaricus]|uniref:CMRF35-like molecule 8 n=1 Tax=Hoplias malabaricus TaxID=27720 RepID=UPI0034629BF9
MSLLNTDKAEMTMKILLIFSLYLISAATGGSRRMRGFSGGGVLIKCRYETQYTSNRKYFCKGSRLNCADQIKTDVKNKWIDFKRFSLFDDTSAAVFSVMIRDLTIKDSGLYQCVVGKWLWDSYTPVELEVEEDLEIGKRISVTGHTGERVNATCKYPEFMRSYPKFFCRRVSSGECFYNTAVKASGEWLNQGKYSLHENRVKNTLSVIISDVREGDSGEYWCGSESGWESDQGYKLYITNITLTVTKQRQPTEISASYPQSLITISTSNTKITAVTTTQEPTSKKRSKGAGVQPSAPNSSETTEPATSSTSTAELSSLSGQGFPSSTVISAVSVVVALLLVGLLLFILTLQKRRKSQASSTSKSLRVSSDVHKVTLAEVDYEEIKDSGVSTIYSTVDLPTHSSDHSSVLYDNIQLHTSPCNISNPIYSTAELPTSLSDSGEGLNYSTVNFCNKADDSDIVITATTNKQQDSCEYATVRH